MSIFYLVAEDSGGGCDYTLACGKDFRRLRATNWAEAREEVIKYLERCGYGGLDELSSVGIHEVRRTSHVRQIRILEVALDEAFDIDTWVRPFLAAAREREDEVAKAERLAQFEQLKKEFEK